MSLPEPVAPTGAIMVPRVWLVETTGGLPKFPQRVTITDDGAPLVVEIHDGAPRPCDLAGYPGREYRHADYPNRLVVLVKIANVSLGAQTGAVVLAWLPARSRAQVSDWFEALESGFPALRRAWRCVLRASGAFEVPGLDLDGTAAATLVKNAWPVDWRYAMPGDPSDGPYTGARFIGSVFA